MRRTLVGATAILVVVFLALLGWRANFIGVRTGPPFGSVAVTFDDPPAYPGYTWVREGREVDRRELTTIAPDHCQWQAATFLFIGWPPGTVAEDASRARQYIRDPQGAIVHDRSFRDGFARNVTLPGDARPTGYKLGSIELYLSPSDQDRWIYVVSPRDIERWPRSDPMTGCA